MGVGSDLGIVGGARPLRANFGTRVVRVTVGAVGAATLLCIPSGSWADTTPQPASATAAVVTNTLGGYLATGKGAVAVDFTVPALTCPRTAIGSISMGAAAAAIGGNSVEAVVELKCAKPAPPTLFAEAVSYCSGNATKVKMFPVVVGNKVSVSVTPSGVASFTDQSRSAQATVTGCVTGMTKAIFGVFCPKDWTIPYPPPTGTPACTLLPGFTKLAFSNATIAGKAISKSKPTPYILQLGSHEVVPGAIGSTGMTFSDSHK